MELDFTKVKSRNNILKKIVNYTKIKIFLNDFKRNNYKIDFLGIDNKELCIEIKEVQTGQILNIIFRILKPGENYLYKIQNDLGLYYSYEHESNKTYDLICFTVAKIIYNNLSRNPSLTTETINILNSMDKEILIYFKNKITIDLISKFWPKIISFKFHSQNYKNKLNLILQSEKNKKYFLKILADDWRMIDNIINISNFLHDKINIPRILDYKQYFDQKTPIKTHWILFEYIQSEEKVNQNNINLIVSEIAKLHNLDFNWQILNFPQLAKGDILAEVKNINHKRNSHLLKEAIKYFEGRKLIKGLCHFDLHPENFIISKNRAYLIDFNMLKYDYVIFDFALFLFYLIDFLINEKMEIYKIIKHYLKNSYKIRYDKELFYYASIIVIYYKYNQKYISANSLKYNLEKVNQLYKAL